MSQSCHWNLRYAYRKHRYHEIKNLYVQQLALSWVDSITSKTCTDIKDKVDGFVERDPEHTREVLTALLEIGSKEGNIPDPADTSSPVSLTQRCFLPTFMSTRVLHTRSHILKTLGLIT